MKAKSMIVFCLQVLAATVGFLLSLLIGNLILPMPDAILAAVPPNGFLPAQVAFALNGLVNAIILVWVGRRSSYKGLKLWGGLLVLSFGAQVFMTQVETAYFLPAFPLLHGNFELYRLVLSALITSALVTLLVTWLVGGFSRKARPEASFTVSCADAVKSGAVAGSGVCCPVHAVRILCCLAVSGAAPILWWTC